jgi:hypothetical protein
VSLLSSGRLAPSLTSRFHASHYYYRLKGEYTVPMTPKGWFGRKYGVDESNPRYSSGRAKNSSPRRTKKRLIVSQSMVIDIDPSNVRFKCYYQLPHKTYEKNSRKAIRPKQSYCIMISSTILKHASILNCNGLERLHGASKTSFASGASSLNVTV